MTQVWIYQRLVPPDTPDPDSWAMDPEDRPVLDPDYHATRLYLRADGTCRVYTDDGPNEALLFLALRLGSDPWRSRPADDRDGRWFRAGDEVVVLPGFPGEPPGSDYWPHPYGASTIHLECTEIPGAGDEPARPYLQLPSYDGLSRWAGEGELPRTSAGLDPVHRAVVVAYGYDDDPTAALREAIAAHPAGAAAAGPQGITPLMLACAHPRAAELAPVLVEALTDADVRARDGLGWTAARWLETRYRTGSPPAELVAALVRGRG